MRDELWEKAVKKSKNSGAVLQVWTDQNPQGFSWRQHGERDRTFIDLEGLFLVKIERDESSGITQNADTENV